MNEASLMPFLAFHIPTWGIVTIIVLAVIAILLFVLYHFGSKMQKRQEETQAQMQANSQVVSMLIIDKKRMPIKDAGLPKMVTDQVPKYMRRAKLPIVKVKAGPQTMNMICDEKIFDQIPVKKEVKAVVSGLYITSVKGLHAPLEKRPEKKKFSQKIKDKLSSMTEPEQAEPKKKKKKK
ncbi:MAG: hypothetical protein PUB10_07160 [Clostridiales bacterium]|nr:hypothetical protein [Clostridiales bacterium]